MLEKKLQFDFSKQKNQKDFGKLAKGEKEKIILEQLKEYFYNGEIEKVEELIKNYKISKEKIKKIALKQLMDNLEWGQYEEVFKIQEFLLGKEQEILKNTEITGSAFEKLKNNASRENIDDLVEIQKEKQENVPIRQKIIRAVQNVIKKKLSEEIELSEYNETSIIQKIVEEDFFYHLYIGANPSEKKELMKVILDGILFKLDEVSYSYIKKHFFQGQEKMLIEIILEIVKRHLKKGNLKTAYNFFGYFFGSDIFEKQDNALKENPEVIEIGIEIMENELRKGDVFEAGSIVDKCLGEQGKKKARNNKETLRIALKNLKKLLKEGRVEKAQTITRAFFREQKEKMKYNLEIIEMSLKGLEVLLKKGKIDDALRIKEDFLSNYDLSHYPFQLYQSQELIVLQKISWEDFEKLFGREAIPDKKYLNSDLTVVENLQNYFANQEKAKKNPDIWKLKGEEKYKNFLDNLKRLKGSVWDKEGNEHEIFSAFQRGAEVFGYEKMFKFIGDYDRHDALFNFDKILKLKEKSNLSPEQFFGQILFQVRKDNSQDAYQRLNKIADRLENVNLEEALNEARQYKDIKSMAQLLENVKTPQDIFLNWKTLQKFDDIADLLNKREILEEIREMPPEKKRLKDYIETLVFHPEINTWAVIEFFKNPKTFLQIEEKHAPEAHELKKPSHYTQIPFLHLTAENLRDAVVEGSLDKIQTFSPAEMYFTVSVNKEHLGLDLKKLIKVALGLRQEKAKGHARHPKKLFAEINHLLKKENTTLPDFLNNKVTLNPETEKQVKEIIFDKSIGLKTEFRNYRAKITWKSDLEAVVAGNDTECCMPFGSGKNNVYTFNPNCGQFVIQVEAQGKGKRAWRTIAQSVLTKDVDIKKPIPKIIKLAQDEHKSMSDFVSDDITEQQKEVVVCDNIEVRPNIERNIDVLEVLYRKFFSEYLKHYATDDNLNNQKFLIGVGNNDLVFGNSIENTFLPVAPVAYSDNVGENVYEVTVNKESQNKILNLWATQISFLEKAKSKEEYPKNIRPLTYADTLKVSYIEGKAYADNQTLMEYLHNMENGLIAKDIYNAHFNRPNLSLAYEDEKGKMKGYLFAYEGEDNGEKVIYISDLAALPEVKLPGGKLIKAFLQLYRKHYLNKDNPLPLLARVREKTSYRIVTKQLNRLSKEVGIEFVLEEIEEDIEGGENMHWVIIRPKKYFY